MRKRCTSRRRIPGGGRQASRGGCSACRRSSRRGSSSIPQRIGVSWSSVSLPWFSPGLVDQAFALARERAFLLLVLGDHFPGKPSRRLFERLLFSDGV